MTYPLPQFPRGAATATGWTSYKGHFKCIKEQFWNVTINLAASRSLLLIVLLMSYFFNSSQYFVFQQNVHSQFFDFQTWIFPAFKTLYWGHLRPIHKIQFYMILHFAVCDYVIKAQFRLAIRWGILHLVVKALMTELDTLKWTIVYDCGVSWEWAHKCEPSMEH